MNRRELLRLTGITGLTAALGLRQAEALPLPEPEPEPVLEADYQFAISNDDGCFEDMAMWMGDSVRRTIEKYRCFS